MLAALRYRDLHVNRCAHRGTGVYFRRVPILCDLASHRVCVLAELRCKALYRCGPCRHGDRRRLRRVPLHWMTVDRREVAIRTRIKYFQAVPGATLRRTKGSDLLHRENAGRIERWRTTRPAQLDVMRGTVMGDGERNVRRSPRRDTGHRRWVPTLSHPAFDDVPIPWRRGRVAALFQCGSNRQTPGSCGACRGKQWIPPGTAAQEAYPYQEHSACDYRHDSCFVVVRQLGVPGGQPKYSGGYQNQQRYGRASPHLFAQSVEDSIKKKAKDPAGRPKDDERLGPTYGERLLPRHRRPIGCLCRRCPSIFASCFPIVSRRVSKRRPVRFEYRPQRHFIMPRVGIVRLLCQPLTPAPVLLIHRQVRMHSLQNPDPQSLEFGRRFNEYGQFISPFRNASRLLPLVRQHANAGQCALRSATAPGSRMPEDLAQWLPLQLFAVDSSSTLLHRHQCSCLPVPALPVCSLPHWTPTLTPILTSILTPSLRSLQGRHWGGVSYLTSDRWPAPLLFPVPFQYHRGVPIATDPER